jgi:hypothetical protein
MDCSVQGCSNTVVEDSDYCEKHQCFIGATLHPMKSKKDPSHICAVRDCNRKATKVTIINQVNSKSEQGGKRKYKIRVCKKHSETSDKFFVKKGTETEAVGGEVSMRNMAVKFLPRFAWEKYPGEKHLPGYSFCGPNSRLDIRLDENGNPKPGGEPISGLDQIAYIHNYTYKYAGDDLDLQHNADLIMLEKLKELKPQSSSERFYRWLCEQIIAAKVRMGMGLDNLREWEPKKRKKYEGCGICNADIIEMAKQYGIL